MISAKLTDAEREQTDLELSDLAGDASRLAVVDEPQPCAQAPPHGAANALDIRTMRRQSRVTGPAEGIRPRVLFPDPRRDGNRPYLRQWATTCASLVFADLASLMAVIAFCSLIGLTWLNPADESSRAAVWLPSISLAYVLINTLMGLYPGVGLGFVDEIRRLSLSITVVAMINAARLRPTSEWFDDRLIFLGTTYVLCLFAAPVVRNVVRKMLARTTWWGFPTIVCGNDAAAFTVDQWLIDNRRLGLRSLGVVADPMSLAVDSASPRFLGPWSAARSIAEEQHVYWAVMVEPEDKLRDSVTTIIEQYLGNIPQVFVVSRLTGIPNQWNLHRMEEGLPGVLVEHHLQLPLPKLVKRGLDLFIAIVAGMLLMPLFLGLAVIIKCTSRGPIFYGHERVGFSNSRFKAWKFRTMVDNAETALKEYLEKHPELHEEWHRDHKLKNDPRVTSIGKWMRKWSVDELPQLWNVLVGEMSAVGPRPIVPDEVVKYGDHFEMFCSVLPGMTGLWQVCGRNDTSFEERIQLGVYYIHHWSLWMDLYLLVRTVHVVLFSKGAY